MKVSSWPLMLQFRGLIVWLNFRLFFLPTPTTLEGPAMGDAVVSWFSHSSVSMSNVMITLRRAGAVALPAAETDEGEEVESPSAGKRKRRAMEDLVGQVFRLDLVGAVCQSWVVFAVARVNDVPTVDGIHQVAWV